MDLFARLKQIQLSFAYLTSGSKKTYKKFTGLVFAGGAIEASEQLRLTRREELLPFPPRGCSLSPPPLPLEQLPYSFQCQPYFKPDSTPLFMPQYKCPQGKFDTFTNW